MPLYLASINSGSNGNCYYIGNEEDAVLIDAGVSCRDTERRMIRLGLSLRKVRAIFISHEHTDHTRGAEVLSRKHGIRIFITDSTYKRSRMKVDPRLLEHFSDGEPVEFGDLRVHPFLKRHDACDPHSFTVHSGGLVAGVFTDIGTACDRLKSHLSKCHAAFLEANYDDYMLEHGRYPLFLKRRIQSEEGHLSNLQALELFLSHRPAWMKLLVLAHLSAENNHPDLVQELFTRHSNGIRIIVASRFEESEVFCITHP